MSTRNVINSNFWQIANADANLNITGITVANIVASAANLGNVANLKIAGGSNGQYLRTDGNGNITFANTTQGIQTSIANYNSSVDIPTANGNVITAVANANIQTVHANGIDLTGNLYTTGNANIVGNIVTSRINATANITALNFTTNGNVSSNSVSTGTLSANGNVNFTGLTVSLGANSSVKITGGANGQFLQTDGNGNLSWAVGGNGGGGNYSNSNVQSYMPTYNGNLGNVNGITASGNILFAGPNITLGNVANVHITGGSNGQVLTTNGTGGLSWTTVSTPPIPPQFLIPTIDYVFTGKTATFTGATNELLNWSFTSNYAPQGANNTGWQANLQTLPTSALWSSVTYGNGVYVAVVTGNSNVASTSSDGITWTQRTMPVNTDWVSVVYGNGTFVATSAFEYNSNIAATSSDGITWVRRTLPVNGSWQTTAYGNGTFVAFAGSSSIPSNIAATSTDGITWTQRTLPVSANWQSITYGNGLFVAVSGIRSNVAITSPDGITWTQRTLPVISSWSGVAFGNGLFVAVTNYFSELGTTATSPDGITWTQRNTIPTYYWGSIRFGNGQFVAFADGAVAATSPDGITWTQRTLPASAGWKTTYGNNIFIGVAYNSSAAFTATTNLPTTYNVYLPADQTYPEQTLTWVPNAANTYIQQASSLGNAITTLRSTYTASYPASGNVVINTNSGGNIPDVTFAQVGTTPTGNLSLTITQGSGVRDIITVIDPDTGESFIYSPGFGDSLGSVVNGIAVYEDIGRWLTSYVGATNSTGIIRFDNIYAGTTTLPQYPTLTVTQGSNSSLVATRRTAPGT